MSSYFGTEKWNIENLPTVAMNGNYYFITPIADVQAKPIINNYTTILIKYEQRLKILRNEYIESVGNIILKMRTLFKCKFLLEVIYKVAKKSDNKGLSLSYIN